MYNKLAKRSSTKKWGARLYLPKTKKSYKQRNDIIFKQ